MTVNPPTFSVVIPVYNGEKYIQAAIESCLQQTVSPSEIIVIDDGSDDATASVIHNINSDLIVYKKNEANRGPSYSRNLGLELAKYDWILFLDADDVFHKQKIEIIGFCISQNDSIKAIGHSFSLTTDPVYNPGADWQKNAAPVPVSAKKILMRNPMVTPSLAVASGNGILFNEKMMYAEDHDFILRTAEKYSTWYLNMPLCSLSRRPLTTGGISSNRWKMRKGEINMYIDYCKRNGRQFRSPFYILFSLFKHVKSILLNRVSN